VGVVVKHRQGGCEESDEEEEGDVPAADTPSNEEKEEDDNDGMMSDGYGRASPFWRLMPTGECAHHRLYVDVDDLSIYSSI
jgi:hypothetical protein